MKSVSMNMELKDQVFDLTEGDSIQVESNQGDSLKGTVDEIRESTGHGAFYEVHGGTGLPGVRFSVSVEKVSGKVYIDKGVKEEDGEYYWEGLGEVESIEEV